MTLSSRLRAHPVDKDFFRYLNVLSIALEIASPYGLVCEDLAAPECESPCGERGALG